MSKPGNFDSGTMLSPEQGAIIVSVCATLSKDGDSIGEVSWLSSETPISSLPFKRSARLGLGESSQGGSRAMSIWYLAGMSEFVGTRGNIAISTALGGHIRDLAISVSSAENVKGVSDAITDVEMSAGTVSNSTYQAGRTGTLLGFACSNDATAKISALYPNA